MSFAFITRLSFPEPLGAKPWLLLLLILAGCGGSGNVKWQQVQGKGFAFNAPEGWTVQGLAASHGDVDRVEVRVFKLEHRYKRATRAAAAGELDNAAESVAQQMKGNVTAKKALQVGGFDARTYSISFDGKVEEITFVLDDAREFELLCRRSEGSSDSACRELVRSFSVASAAR